MSHHTPTPDTEIQAAKPEAQPEAAYQEINEAKTLNIPITAILALLLSMGAMFLSWQNRQQIQQNSIKVVDLAEISRFYQEQARQQGLKDGVSAEQRAQILQVLQFKMNSLQKAIDEYVQSCACNIWVKSAVVGRNQQVEDVTPIIMSLVDKKITQSGFIAQPNSIQNQPIQPNSIPNLNQNNGGTSPAFPNQ